jgi:hypothetical protein
MKIKTSKAPASSFIPYPHGWGNGYIGVPSDHPWFGVDYDEIHAAHDDLRVHGGLTYSDHYNCGEKCEDKNYWWVGFDTAHECDGPHLNEAYVDGEIDNLKKFAEKVGKND